MAIIDGNVNIESYIGQITFGSNMIESADRQFGVGNWAIMPDKARPHVSKENFSHLKRIISWCSSRLATIHTWGYMSHYEKKSWNGSA